MSGISMICDYCGQPAQHVSGDIVYPHRHDLYSKKFYMCVPCDAYVGCHADGKPLGRLANHSLRTAKMRAHVVFDSLWQSGRMTRHAAYKWLSHAMDLPKEQTHIGMFDIGQCLTVEQHVKDLA